LFRTRETNNAPAITLNNSLIQNNKKIGIFNDECTAPTATNDSLYINNSVIKNNGSNLVYSLTGGIESCGHLEIKNSEISSNSGVVTGGVRITGSLDQTPSLIENSTIANNTAFDDGGTGGVYVYEKFFQSLSTVIFPDTIAIMRNNTIANNTGFISGLKSTSNNLTLTNNLVTNIVLDEPGTSLCYIAAPNPVVSINLGNVSSGASCTGFSKTNFNPATGFGSTILTNEGNLRPNVGAGSLGGKTRTLPIVQSSTAINAGLYTNCLPQDQFGNNRLNTSNTSGVLATACEACAFELPTDPNVVVIVTPPQPNPPTPTPTSTFSGFGGLIRTGGGDDWAISEFTISTLIISFMSILNLKKIFRLER
jgi:hypothetical protein